MPTLRTIGTVITSATRDVAFDITTSDTWSGDVQWTERPVSPQRTTQDHGTLSQKTFDLAGVITTTTVGPVLASEPQRMEILRDQLMAMRDERLPCTIVNGFHVLEDYVIKSLSMSRSAPAGNRLEVSISFVQLETTESRETTIPPAVVFAGAASDMSPLGDLGTPANEEDDTATAAEAEELRAANAGDGYDHSGWVEVPASSEDDDASSGWVTVG